MQLKTNFSLHVIEMLVAPDTPENMRSALLWWQPDDGTPRKTRRLSHDKAKLLLKAYQRLSEKGQARLLQVCSKDADSFDQALALCRHVEG